MPSNALITAGSIREKTTLSEDQTLEISTTLTATVECELEGDVKEDEENLTN